jgi:hypothetical protein
VRPLVWLIVAALIQSASALGETRTCSTWQGITTCLGPGGYVSHEWDRDGMRFGDDNQGDRWTSWRWQDTTITRVEPPPGR